MEDGVTICLTRGLGSQGLGVGVGDKEKQVLSNSGNERNLIMLTRPFPKAIYAETVARSGKKRWWGDGLVLGLTVHCSGCSRNAILVNKLSPVLGQASQFCTCLLFIHVPVCNSRKLSEPLT